MYKYSEYANIQILADLRICELALFVNSCTRSCIMFEYSFIDLDSTIFETHLLAKAMREIFRNYNVSDADFDISMDRAIRGDGNFYDYTFEKQIENLIAIGYSLPESIAVQLNNLFQINYRAPGVEEFLKFVRQVSDRVILLSAGNPEFQYKKINSAGLENFFDEINILHGKKDEFVRQKIGGQANGLFINDNVGENTLIKNNFDTVLVVARINPRKTEEEYRESGIPYFDSLSGIQQYVEKKLV